MPRKKKEKLEMNKWLMLLLGMVAGFLIGWFFFGYVVTDTYADEKPNNLCKWTEWKDTTRCKALECGTSKGMKGQERQCVAEECEYTCPVIVFKWFNKTFHIEYEKSQDPHKCHRPSDNDLRDLGMSHTARLAFKRIHSEWKDAKVGECKDVVKETQARRVECEAKVVPCPTCETEKWSCEACQHNPREYQERLGICFEPFMQFCNKEYGCKFVGDCNSESLLKCEAEWVCEDTCGGGGQGDPDPTPTPTPPPADPEPTPEPPKTNTTSAPVCGATVPEKPPANVHVYRKGDCAEVKWVPDGKDAPHAHIYYKENSSDGWQYSVRDIENTGSYMICGLGSMDITFAVQQANDCAAGEMSHAVIDGPTDDWVLFR